MDAVAVRTGGPRRCPWRLKDVERLVDRLEADNFNRALRINFLEEQLLAHERRLAPGALDLAEEAQQLREAVQMRDAELSEAYGKLASLEEAMRHQRMAMDAEWERAVMEAREVARDREEALERVRQELAACAVEKEQFCSAKQAAEESKRALEQTVESLQQQARSNEEVTRARHEGERQERDHLEEALREQTAKVATLRAEADSWRSKYVEAGSEVIGLRATVAGCKKAVQNHNDEVKRFKIALAKAKGAQRKAAARDEAVRILLEQLKETQRLIEATKARISGLDSPRHAKAKQVAATTSRTAFTILNAIQRDIREIERGLTVKA